MPYYVFSHSNNVINHMLFFKEIKYAQILLDLIPTDCVYVL